MSYLNPRYEASFRLVCEGSRKQPAEVVAYSLGRCPNCKRLLRMKKDGSVWEHRKR